MSEIERKQRAFVDLGLQARAHTAKDAGEPLERGSVQEEPQGFPLYSRRAAVVTRQLFG